MNEPRMHPTDRVWIVAALAVVVAVGVPILLATFSVDGWATREPLVTGLAVGLTVYHLGILTAIALGSDG